MDISIARPHLAMSLADQSREQPREKSRRLDWADIAKGVSIILLVLWHTTEFHPAFGLLRMPLFFFVAGLFAYDVIARGSFGDFLRNKVGGLIYLYMLWALIYIALTRTVPGMLENPVGDFKRWLQILWSPPLTLWFIYALAVSFLLARLLFRQPFWLVFAAAALVYAASSSQGFDGPQPFVLRIGLLFPFFWMGLFALPLARDLVGRHHRFWPLATGVFLLCAFLSAGEVFPVEWLLNFLISWVGIAGVVLFARSVEGTLLGTWLAYLGGATLYIYLMHRIGLYYMDMFTDAQGWQSAAPDMVKTAILLVGCAALGKWAHHSRFGWAFTAPWLPLRPQ